MKKLLVLFLAILMLLSFASCLKVDVGDGSDFKYSQDYVKQNLTGDYSITYKLTNVENGKVESTSQWTSVRTADGFYFETKDEDGNRQGSLFVRSGDKFVACNGSIEDGFEKPDPEYAYEIEAENVELYYGGAGVGFMTTYTDMANLMKKDGTETIAGRKCDKFKAGITIFGQGIQYVYSVDQQTGICMKYALAARTADGSGAVEFECTELKLGNVSLPSYR